jgi:hypothetical protein
MKKTLSVLALAGALTMSANAAGSIIISEIVDATLPGGLPKFVELANVGDASVDLSSIWIGNFNNGSTNIGGGAAFQLSGNLAPGDAWVISYESSDGPGTGIFYDTYGFDPDEFGLGAFINGDDAVAIFDGPYTNGVGDGNILDSYGVIGVDGTGEPWEYTDGFSFRLDTVTGPNPTWTQSEWYIGGPNSLETGDDATELPLILASTSPGVWPNVIPEPSTFALGGFGLLTLLLARRRS